jgi:glycosyltransferase involved in cell wall biosynthesis
LLTVARLEKEKLVEDALQAMSVVVRDHPDAVLLLAGKGSQQEALARLADNLGIEHNVRFLGLTPQQTLSRLAPETVVLSPLTGMALLETSMAGAPPVAYDCDSSVSDLVESGVTGELIEPRDWRRMGEAASSILSDPKLRSRYAKAVRARAEYLSDRKRLFGIERQAFEQLLSEAKPGSNS